MARARRLPYHLAVPANALRSPLLAWGTSVVTLTTVAATSVLVLLNLESIRDPDQANLIEIVLPISFAVLGAGTVREEIPGPFCFELPRLRRGTLMEFGKWRARNDSNVRPSDS